MCGARWAGDFSAVSPRGFVRRWGPLTSLSLSLCVRADALVVLNTELLAIDAANGPFKWLQKLPVNFKFALELIGLVERIRLFREQGDFPWIRRALRSS